MSAVVLSIAARQPADVQRRAAAAVTAQRERNRQRPDLAAVLDAGQVAIGIVGHASLDAWYRAQPVAKGRMAPALRLSPDEKRLYGLPASARLFDLRGIGPAVDSAAVVLAPVMGGYVVGVKLPHTGGVGVLWRQSSKASDYAYRLSKAHGLTIRDRYI